MLLRVLLCVVTLLLLMRFLHGALRYVLSNLSSARFLNTCSASCIDSLAKSKIDRIPLGQAVSGLFFEFKPLVF